MTGMTNSSTGAARRPKMRQEARRMAFCVLLCWYARELVCAQSRVVYAPKFPLSASSATFNAVANVTHARYGANNHAAILSSG